MTKELTAAFDYSQVDGDTKGKLIRLAGQINKYSGAMVDSANELRQSVHEAHKLLSKARKGLFDEWVDRETDVGRSTAYNMLSVSAREANYPIFGQLPLSAGYLLAASGVPDGAIKEVEKAVEKGARPTVELIKSTLAKFREVGGKSKGKGRTSSPKKLHSQSDEPPTTAEDESPQSNPINAPAVKKDAAKPGPTFDPAELQSESKDAFGKEPPDELEMVFQLREGFKAQRDKLASIKTWITQNENHPGAKVLATAAQRIRTDVDHADSELKFSAPYCVCVYCHNKAPKVANCNACKGLGWITEPIYKAAPKGMQREKVKG